MSLLPSAAEVTGFHDERLGRPVAESRFSAGVWAAIETNHRHNRVLWDEEDLARRRNVPDSEIAANKRAIDTNNQKRNDAIERIDEALLEHLERVARKDGARQNSETAGAMIDRLSILSLKIHHMELQTKRPDVDADHVATCAAKVARFREQRADLSACLDRLLAEAQRGESYFKVYRQFKMYNDPKLNPAIYGETRGGKT
jgi:hypothetical protein